MADATKEHIDALAADVDGLRKEIADVRVLAKELKQIGANIREAAQTSHDARYAAAEAKTFARKVSDLTAAVGEHEVNLEALAVAHKATQEDVRELTHWRNEHRSEYNRIMGRLQERVHALEKDPEPPALEDLSDAELFAELEEALDFKSYPDELDADRLIELRNEVKRRREAIEEDG